MPTYKRFIFEAVNLDPKTRQIHLDYSLDGTVKFRETISLPAGLELNLDHPDLPAALFALHLAGGASYYKTYCPPVIEVNSGQLTADQAEFWDTLYTHGLGEFFYHNQIDFHGLINFPATAATDQPPRAQPTAQPPRRILTAFGGGKDSLVSVELLRRLSADQTLFRVREHRLITELAATAQLPLLTLGRSLDSQLFELNTAGAYNGHVPITAYISFLSVVVALLADFDAVAFSSERSSSYGNVKYLGMMVNHQWSKSHTAETLVRGYIEQFVTPQVQYLNLLRP